MKTPSPLAIFLLVAALPTGAAAELKPGERCDTAFLEKVSGAFSEGKIVTDAARIDEKSDGGSTLLTLKFGEAKICDAGTWRYLAGGTPRVWRKEAAGKYWDAGNAGPNAALVLAADDFYRAFDAKALKVLSAADAVIEAAVQLNIVTVADTAKPLSDLLLGASGGPIGAIKPKAVAFVEADKQSAKIPQESVGAVLRKLTDENGTADGIGSAVLDFRMAVLELNAELGRLGASRDIISSRTGKFQLAAPAVADFMPGLPDQYAAADPKKDVALDPVKFKSAFDALIGTGEKVSLEAAGPRSGSALDASDMGARNLIAVRGEQITEIVKSARARLKGKSISALEVAGRAGDQAKGATPLGGAALKALAGTRAYITLDALYEQSREKKGLQDPETVALAKARDELKAAALSTTIEAGPDGRQSVVFTDSGRKHVLPGIVPPKDGPTGDAARENAAAIVARFIVDEAHSRGALTALWEVTRNDGLKPGGTYPSGVTNEELPAATEVPPAIAKINAEGAGCKDPRDAYRNNFESYAARKQKAAAEISSGNSRSRDEIQTVQASEKADSKIECARRRAAANELKADSFTSKADLAALRAAAKAEADKFCEADISEIDGRAEKAFKALAVEENGTRDPNKNIPQANKELDEAFQLAITGSVYSLRKEYTNPMGGPKVTKLMTDAGLNALSLKKATGLSMWWFMTYWPEGEELGAGGAQAERKARLTESLKNCKTALGFAPITVKDSRDKASKDSDISYSNPENPETVSRKCKIHADLTAYIKSQKPKD